MSRFSFSQSAKSSTKWPNVMAARSSSSDETSQRMKRNRFLVEFAGLAFVAGFLASSLLPAQTREEESKVVYSSVFDSLFHQGSESPGMIVLKDSTSWEAGNVVYRGRLQQPHKSLIGQEVIDDFTARVVPPIAIDESFFSYSKPIAFIGNADAFRLDTLGKKTAPPQSIYEQRFSDWSYGFAKEYPKAWGVTSVSQVGFNRAKTEALVFVGHFCGMCYHDETFYLRKLDGRWRVIERIPFRQQDGLGPGEIRYLGQGAEFLPRLRRTQDSTRRAIADSIARDALPRTLNGTALNHAAGLPISNAQVFLRHHGNADTPEERKRAETFLRTVTDSFGRFEFLNPPIGVTTLILECPGATFSESIGLDMRVAFVRQGGDTSVTLVAPDIAPCWPPQRIHRLFAGKLESAEARDSSMPDAEETLVYRAALTTILGPRKLGHARMGLVYQTVIPCKRVKTCGTAQFPRLIFLGVLDSALVSGFVDKSAKPLAFRDDFVRSLHFDPITPEDLNFLREQGEARVRFSPHRDESSTDLFWDAFGSAYPRSAGLASFTRIGFNRLHSLALLEVTLDERGWMDKPELLLLARSGGTWRVIRRHIEMERTSGMIAGGKCVPSTGIYAVEQRPLQDIEGLYRFTFVTDQGSVEIPERTFLFVPDSVLRSKARALKAYPGRGISSGDPFPSSFRVPSFELLDRNGKRDEGTEFGITLFSGRIPFHRFMPAFNPDGVIGKGENIEILSVRPGEFGGTWIENDFWFLSRRGAEPRLRSQGHFCAEKITSYRSEMNR